MERSSMAEMVSKVLEREKKETTLHTYTHEILNRLLSSMTANRQNCSF